MKKRTLQLLALLLTLALCWGLAACGSPLPEDWQQTGQGDGPQGEQDPANPAQAGGSQNPAQPEIGNPAQETGFVPGRWRSEDGSAELWIQSVDANVLRFSLFVPGVASINEAEAVLGGEETSFLYDDPYHKGEFANGSLQLADGSPVLQSWGSGTALAAGTEYRFPVAVDGPDYLTLYAPVLDALRIHEQNGGGFTDMDADKDALLHVELMDVKHFAYAFYDFDNNGIPELLIGPRYTEENFAQSAWLEPEGYYANIFVNLYTLRGDAPVCAVISGNRYRYSLTDDGQIYFEGSSGAAYTYRYLYRFDGDALVLVDGVCMDGGEDLCFHVLDDQDFDHLNDEPISYEEFEKRAAELGQYGGEKLAQLRLRPLIADEAAPTAAAEDMNPAYAEILTAYGNLLALPYSRTSGMNYTTPLTWLTLIHRYGKYYEDSPFDPYYALYDLDGNGTDELFIGLGQPDGSVMGYEVYSSDGQRAYRIATDPTWGMRIGGGKLLLEMGEYEPNGLIIGLSADGYTPEWLLYYSAIFDDPDLEVYDGDESKLTQYYDIMGLHSEDAWRPYEELREKYLYDMVPADEVLNFIRIQPEYNFPPLSASVEATRAAFASLLERYDGLARGTDSGEGLDDFLVEYTKACLEHSESPNLSYAFFDGNCDGREELYVGCVHTTGTRIVVCYEIQGDGSIASVDPPRFTGAWLDGNRAPWRYLEACPESWGIRENG